MNSVKLRLQALDFATRVYQAQGRDLNLHFATESVKIVADKFLQYVGEKNV